MLLLVFSESVAEQGSVLNAASEGYLVGVFDFVAHAYTACQHGDFYIGIGCEASENVEIGGVALHSGTKSENHLFHVALLHALLKTVDLYVGWANAVHWRYESTKHMVEAMVSVGILFFHILYHAHHRLVARWVGADGAHFALAYVVAHLAVGDALAQLDD